MTDQHDHDGPDAALRADIRRLGTLLGQTLARQEGPPLLDLVEEIRALVRSDAEAAADAARARWTSPPAPSWPAPSPPTSTWPTSPSRCTAPATCAGSRATARRLAGPGGQADRRARGAGRGDRRGRPAAGRTTGVHRPPDRGRPPLDPDQAARSRRRAGRRGRRRGALRRQRRGRRPTAGSPSCSTCCGRPTSCGWTGRTRPTRPATRSTTCATCTPTPRRRCSTTSPTRCASSAWRPRRRPAR